MKIRTMAILILICLLGCKTEKIESNIVEKQWHPTELMTVTDTSFIHNQVGRQDFIGIEIIIWSIPGCYRYGYDGDHWIYGNPIDTLSIKWYSVERTGFEKIILNNFKEIDNYIKENNLCLYSYN